MVKSRVRDAECRAPKISLMRLDTKGWDSVHSEQTVCVASGREGIEFRDEGGRVVKLNVRDRESIQEAVRRFRKLVERSGIKKEMRRREYYEKPSETRRRARLRAARRGRTNLLEGI